MLNVSAPMCANSELLQSFVYLQSTLRSPFFGRFHLPPEGIAPSLF